MGYQPRTRYLTANDVPWWVPPAWVCDRQGWIDAAREVASSCGERLPSQAADRYRVATGRMREAMFVHAPPPPTSAPD